MAILRSSTDIQPQTEAEIHKITSGPHTYQEGTGQIPGRYVFLDPAKVDSEYPRVMYRKRTEEEIEIEKANLSQERWLDKEEDLTQLTGSNQVKKVQNWLAYVTRPVEEDVHNQKEQKKLESAGWTASLKEVREAK
jgi:hypothetical protein